MQHDDIRHRFRWQFKTGPGVDNSVPDSWLSAIFSLCANVDVLIQGELREGFHWLEQQPLSISRPPLGLPRHGKAYFAEDVLTSMDSVHH